MRDEQIALVREIAAAVAAHGAMVNEVLRVGEVRSMRFETVPAP